MSVIIKGHVDVTHSYTGSNGNFKYALEDLNISQDEWDEMQEEERQAFLDEVLDTEISNTLDAGIWYEEEE